MILETLSRPWPWYVAGPLIGLMVPLLLLGGARAFGISSSHRQICAAILPGRLEFLRDYDWRSGAWRLVLVAGVLVGGFAAAFVLPPPEPYIVGVAEATRADLAALGIRDFQGLVPGDVFSFAGLRTSTGFVLIVVGGFLLGFGARYAGGCTSGHGITGLAAFQLASLFAVAGFFVGGLLATHLLFPLLF